MPELSAGDTAWVLTSTALVLFMTPGLALFYGGMVRTKNVLAMLMQNFFAMGIVTVLWVVIGYSLAFGDAGNAGVLGNLDFAGLKDLTNGVTGTIPTLAFVAFQLTFAVITPALITGAIADRMRWSAWVWFITVWSLIVYVPVAHWVFAGGWLADRGALDFAGGTVVHVNAGAGALALILLLGRRRGWPDDPMPPHSLPLTLLGTGILWFGWFGFNAGSALAANGVAAQAFLNTFVAAAAAMLGWLIVERLKSGHATTLGAASGAVAGLVAITPCAGFVGGLAPVVIGAIAGAVCFLAIQLKYRFRYDDSLDVIAVHLVGGIIGSVLLGLFADDAVNPAGKDGVFLGGGWGLFGEQVLAVAVVLVFSFVVSGLIGLALKAVLPGGIRVSEDDEDAGLDLSQHAETGYALERV
ncbi:MAG TPA: ammonium transporter [Jatrophihabitantaceae bacterium]|nr:ammonium transporter [Jatrophihabitantaceae bacterium]